MPETGRYAGLRDRNTVTVQDIDEDGTVLGTVWYDDGNTNLRDRAAIVWYPDGTWRLLPGLQPDAETSGTSIRSGHVLGVQVDGRAAPILRWNAQTGDVSALRDGFGAFSAATRGWCSDSIRFSSWSAGWSR